MGTSEWHIYLGKIPYSGKGNFWVSFESEPNLKKSKTNIYGRCLPCIQNLYYQLKDGRKEITLGSAYHCWKISAVVKDIDECIALLYEFEKRCPGGHVYGKFGSGRPNADTKVVVFHTENTLERNRVRDALKKCLPQVNPGGKIEISRACAVLYNDLFGDWRRWEATTRIKYPKNIEKQLKIIKKILYRASM